MRLFTDRHVIAALLVAPVMAVIAWFGIGALVAEKPFVAQPGESYPLVAGSSCRYDSGRCDLRNEDLHLGLTLEGGGQQPVFLLSSNRRLEGVLLSVASGDEATPPTRMRREDSTGQRWRLGLADLPTAEQRLRVVVQSGGSNWFVDTSTAFLTRYREKPRNE